MDTKPYIENDIVSLENQYQIVSLKEEISTSWIFEAIQLPSRKRVLVKVFNNKGFLNIKDVEIAWNNEIESSKLGLKLPEYKGDYIESGIVLLNNEKTFIIIYESILILEKPIEDYLSTKDRSEADIGIPAMAKAPQKISEDEKVSIETPKPESSVGSTKPVKNATEETYEGISERPKPKTPTSAAPTTGIRRKATISPKPSLEEEMISGVEAEEDFQKHVSMEYYDRMNPQNYYSLTINISDIKGERKIPVINPITGERKVQKMDKMDVALEDPIVLIKPSIPGCNVEPRELETDFTKPDDIVTFYVTPIVKGKIEGKINFISDGKVIHTTDFNAKVVDPRFARAVAFYGILTGFIPEILSLLGINLGLSKTLNELWSVAENTIGQLSIAGLIGIGGIVPVVIISLVVRQMLKPKSCRVHYKLRDHRRLGVK